MVDVGMGQQYEVDVSRLYGQFHIFVQILALLHAAVHQTADGTCFNECAAACHFVGSADEC